MGRVRYGLVCAKITSHKLSGTLNYTTLDEMFTDPDNPGVTARLTGTWSEPPAVLLPGAVVKLQGSASAKFSKGFGGDVGMSVTWVISGNAEVLQLQKAYAGMINGAPYIHDSEATCQIRVGRGGGQIVIAMAGQGNIGRNPCTYTYEWMVSLA